MEAHTKIPCKWSPDLAYLVGLIATDGNLSSDGRHVNLTSKDADLLEQIRDCFHLRVKVGKKSRIKGGDKIYSVLQIGDIHFYKFLLAIGLTPNKSKTISQLNIPKELFSDFLRGCIDGDGSITIAKHSESKHPQLRLRLCSASPAFLHWVKNEVHLHLSLLGGWIQETRNSSISTLCYGKSDSIQILEFMYNSQSTLFLQRKYSIVENFWASGGIGIRASLRN